MDHYGVFGVRYSHKKIISRSYINKLTGQVRTMFGKDCVRQGLTKGGIIHVFIIAKISEIAEVMHNKPLTEQKLYAILNV